MIAVGEDEKKYSWKADLKNAVIQQDFRSVHILAAKTQMNSLESKGSVIGPISK